MKAALTQLNPTVGAVRDNLIRIEEHLAQAATDGVDLVILPEQALIGYPAKDLLLRDEVIDANQFALQRLQTASGDLGIGVLVGACARNPQPTGRLLHNAAYLFDRGAFVGVTHKQLLPNYDVFDEHRYFEPGGPSQPLIWRGLRLGVTICEDLLGQTHHQRKLYTLEPAADLAAQRVDLLINLSASPFVLGKQQLREQLLSNIAQSHQVPLLYVNQVGGNDELVFDGASCVIDRSGKIVSRAASFAEDQIMVDLDPLRSNAPYEHAPRAPLPADLAALHDALVLGIRDYLQKCGFRDVIIGLSGGIDSAVTAALAVEAIGPERVRGVGMPSRYSSDHSLNDARELASQLDIRFDVIEIEAIHHAYEQQLAPTFAGRDPDVTEENIQSRVRGGLLMALSNKFGALVLTTGNKSELAVGYCTLYGDMCGGLAVISDVPKTRVYELARYINAQVGKPVIPVSTIEKPPSAELRPDQRDSDSLPDYDVLDRIIEQYEEQGASVSELVDSGIDRETVERIVALLRRNEYKRQQAAPGLKVTTKAFGFGRRMPIAARSRSS